MKNTFVKLLMIGFLACMLIGCGNQKEVNNTEQSTTTEIAITEVEEPSEAPHEHAYVESITAEPTCEEDGQKTFNCECGDSYTESVAATGHNYEAVAGSAVEATCNAEGKEADTKCTECGNVVDGEVIAPSDHNYEEYVYNNDATTLADGTETAICSVCGETDTRTKAGTKLEISYVGYDEFGNGYTLDASGDKVFYCNSPYPINAVIDNGGKEIYTYNAIGTPIEISHPSICNTLSERYNVPSFGTWKHEDGEWIQIGAGVHHECTRLGYYNGQMILLFKFWVD